MEAQAVAQGQGPQPPAIVHRVPGQHLRLRCVGGVQAIQRVEHQEGMIADLGCGVGDGVQHREVHIGDEAQHAGRLGDSRLGKCRNGAG